MRELVSLSEFVDAFTAFGPEVTADSWVLKDLGLDADELDWVIRDIERGNNWRFHFSVDLSGYLPFQAWGWTRRDQFADLKLRELYAFSTPSVANV